MPLRAASAGRAARPLAATAVLAAAAVVAALAPGPAAATRPPAEPPASASAVEGAAVIDAASSTATMSRLRRVRVPATARQVIVVRAATWTTSWATLEAFERTASGGWVRRFGPMSARVGARGMVVGSVRRQGTMKTPAGFYRITQAFGRYPDPGTTVPYTRVGWDHWWVQDNYSRYYNYLRRGSQGGFLRTERGARASERLYRFNPEYDYSAVIDFNRPKPVRYRGSGIFLHIHGGGATAGCVSVTRAQMVALLRWMQPAKRPVIIMGEDNWLYSR
jgi:L,D-peptidoglycan transpeptidase YkuD (ErfK/YbiS/YcfS/YnhG family)